MSVSVGVYAHVRALIAIDVFSPSFSSSSSLRPQSNGYPTVLANVVPQLIVAGGPPSPLPTSQPTSQPTSRPSLAERPAGTNYPLLVSTTVISCGLLVLMAVIAYQGVVYPKDQISGQTLARYLTSDVFGKQMYVQKHKYRGRNKNRGKGSARGGSGSSSVKADPDAYAYEERL